MIKVIFQNIEYPSITFSEIRIEIGTGDVTATYYPRLCSIGPFVLGYDDPDNILFMYPGSLSIEFLFPVADNVISGICTPSVSQADSDYYATMGALRYSGGVIYVYKAGQTDPYFCAAYDEEDDGMIEGDDTNRKIALEFLDDYTKLNEQLTFVGSDSSGYPGGGGHLSRKSIKKFIKELFEYSNRRRTLSLVNSIQYYIDFQFTRIKDYKNGDVRVIESTEKCTLQNIGIDNWLFYNHETKADCFKTVLRNLAAYAIIDFQRNLKILPVYYNGGVIKNILKEQIEGDNKTDFSKRYDGLTITQYYAENADYYNLKSGFKDYGSVIRVLVGNANLRNNDGGRGTGVVYGDYLIRNDSKVFHLDIYFACGGSEINNEEHYSNSLRVLYAANDVDVFNYDENTVKLNMIKANAVSYKKGDGSWSEEKSLGDWCGWLTWQTLSNKSRWKKAKLPVLNYSFGDYFHVEGLDATFRPVQISYYPDDDQTGLVLTECTPIDSYSNPTSIHFNKILRAFYYTVTIKKRLAQQSMRYIDTDGASKSTGPDYPYLGKEEITIKIKNVYNCASSTAVEYDGISLVVSDYDKKLWKGIWDYVFYIAIGKTKDTAAPASEYPVANDANADWYLLGRITDEKIDNPEYYYKLVFSASLIKTKNPFWFWCGLKSSEAPFFEGITRYTV